MSYFLWFFLLLSIPILVHLFSFRRAKRLFFTNVRFIRLASTETKSRTKLKQLLVLSCRVLAFIFLILAFVASFVRFEQNDIDTGNSIGLIYLDNSNSAVGIDIGDDAIVVQDLLAGDQAQNAQLLTNDFAPFSNRNRSRDEVLAELKDLTVSYVTRGLDEVLNRARNGSKIYLISDFEDASVAHLDRVKEDSTSKYYFLVNDDSRNRRNVFVDSLWLEKDLDNYENTLLRCALGRSDNFREGSVVVKLLDKQGRQISSVVKRLQDDPLITFSLPERERISSYIIQLNGDDVSYDNEFYFVLNRNPRPRILLLSESRNAYLESVFGNEELFQFDAFHPNDFDYERLNDTDLLVLNDFDRFPKGLVSQAIQESSVFIFPSDSVDVENYGQEGLSSISYNANLESQQMQLEEGNPLMEGAFRADGAGIILPEAVQRYSISNAHERLLTLRGGGTFFGKLTDQPLYFLMSPLKITYTELPTHSIFLPLMYRVAERSVNKYENLFTYPGEFIEIETFSMDVPPKIISGDTELIPEFLIQNQNAYAKIPSSLRPGFYHILQEEDTVQSFGINISKNESIFDGLSFEEIDDFFADSDHVEVISLFDGLEESKLTSQESNHLWKYALILAVMFLLIETLFHRYLK